MIARRVVWLSKTWPIKRRWEFYLGKHRVFAIPLTTVEWSRHEPPPKEEQT